MQRSRRARVSRIPLGRGRAVTFADRISAGGTAVAVVISLIAALAAGVSVAHGVRTAAASRSTGAAPPSSPPRSRPQPSPTHRIVIGVPVTELTSAVRHVMSTQQGPAARRDYGTGATAAPVVHVTRTSPDRSWVFGTTVIPVPAGSAAPPWTALFLAHADGGRWDIALSGTAGFGRMLAAAEVLTAAEKQLLARFSAVQAAPAASAARRPGSGGPGSGGPGSGGPGSGGPGSGGRGSGGRGSGGRGSGGPVTSGPGSGGPVHAAAPATSPPGGNTSAPAGTASPGYASPSPGGVTPSPGGVTPSPRAASGGTTSVAGSAAPGTAGLELPWRAGESWRLVAAFGGAGQAASMLAFSGGDGRVRAAGPGRLYRFCGGPGSDALIEVIHPDGSATEYYQLRAETRIAEGSLVAAGAYLGMTGTSMSCGGTVPGPGPGEGAGNGKRATNRLPGTVAFAVIGSGGVMSLADLTLGGWTFHEQAKPPLVSARRAAVRVRIGGLLKNFGLSAIAPATAAAAPMPAAHPTPSNSLSTPSPQRATGGS